MNNAGLLKEEWFVAEDGSICAEGVGPVDTNSEGFGMAASAAPDMARALLHLWNNVRCDWSPGTAVMVREALLKAGVLPTEMRTPTESSSP